MTQQLTVPPAHVWDRIEKILDEQEFGNRPKKLFSNTLRRSVNNQPVNYFLAVTGAGILALIMLTYSPVLKNN
jgi:hypothetical protein